MDTGCLPSQIKNRKRSWLINAALLGIVTLASLLTFFVGDEEVVVSEVRIPQRKLPLYAEIGWGPLALNGMRSQGPLPFLTREVVVLGKNSRPDVKGASFLLGLNSSQEEMIVEDKQPVFLVKGEDDKWHFSLLKTALCLVPTSYETGRVLLHVRSSFIRDEEGSFVLKVFDKTSHLIEKTPYVKALEGAKFWGHDLFIKNYGGSDFRNLVKKNKIEVDGQVYFIGEGDLLIWRDGAWHWTSTSQPSVPLAKVIAQSSADVQLQVWDESGFHSIILRKSLEKPQKISHKSEELFSSVRIRTPSEITCLLGKRRVILKEGDWWLKMNSGWKKLKTVSDIEGYLDHRLKGELFIFETISTDKGQVVLKGNSFDVMRTEMQPLSVTASLSKKMRSYTKKQNPPLIAKTDERKREGVS